MGVKKIKPIKNVKTTAPEVESFSESLVHWMELHSRKILGGAALILVLVAGFWGYQAYSKSREARAQNAYGSVLAAWPTGESSDPAAWEKFAALSKEFIEQHKGSSAAVRAQLDLARAEYSAGRYEEAYRLGRELQGRVSDSHPLKPLMEYQLALTSRQLGKNDESLAHWQSLQKRGASGLDREIHWHMAGIYVAAKDYAKGAEHYEQALKATGTYPGDEMIQHALASAKAMAGGKS